MLLVPSGPPTDIGVTAITSTSALLSWNPPLTEHHNGILTSYTVQIFNGSTMELIISIETTNTTLNLSSLKPYTQYRCTVSASTSNGQGPISNYTSFQTQQDGMFTV